MNAESALDSLSVRYDNIDRSGFDQISISIVQLLIDRTSSFVVIQTLRSIGLDRTLDIVFATRL